MDRVFLDANVLFSAAYRDQSRLARLWTIPDTALVTSQYAIEEARRNLDRPEQQARLAQLAADLEIIQNEDVVGERGRWRRVAGERLAHSLGRGRR